MVILLVGIMKKVIANCCVCGGPIYSDGSDACDKSEWAKAHTIDIIEEREKFLSLTGMTPEEYLIHHNQDCGGEELHIYHEAIFLSLERRKTGEEK